MIEIQVDGLVRATARFDRIALAAQNPSAAFNEIQQAFYAAEKRLFETAGFGTWSPDLPSTTRRKARSGQDLRTMRATDALFRALTGSGSGAVTRATGSVLVMGTNLNEARYGQHGRGRESRRVIALSRGMRRQFADIVLEHIAGER